MTYLSSWRISSINSINSEDLDVSENSGTPKSSILIGFSIINHPFWGTSIFGNTQLQLQYYILAHPTTPSRRYEARTRARRGGLSTTTTLGGGRCLARLWCGGWDQVRKFYNKESNKSLGGGFHLYLGK